MLVTWVHYGIIRGWWVVSLKALGSGVALRCLFTYLQGFEYYVAMWPCLLLQILSMGLYFI